MPYASPGSYQKKRNGEALTSTEIRFFVNGLVDGSIASEQVSALAMATCFQSMNFTETGWAVDGIGGLVVDKHSMGGVGGKVSVILAPLAADSPSGAFAAASEEPATRPVIRNYGVGPV